MKVINKLHGYFVLIFIFISIISAVIAKVVINSNEVLFDNTSSKFAATNVQDAVDEMYSKFEVCTTFVSWKFDYTGAVQTFTVPSTGTYLFEVWGAQGGKDANGIGGYGSYSAGTISLTKGSVFYVVVGGQGKNGTGGATGGYNGGGAAGDTGSSGGGGGATHIATSTGLLSSLSENKTAVIIVAGGGGGGGNSVSPVNGGSGGGITGVNGAGGIGGSQTAGGTGTLVGTFGAGGNRSGDGGGGGGGYYGGGAATGDGGGAGGSGYVGNALLSSKSMYCYNCTKSDAVDSLTIPTTEFNLNPVGKTAKSGNGYAKITLLHTT